MTSTERRRCIGITKKNEQCKLDALPEQRHCGFHVDQAQEAQNIFGWVERHWKLSSFLFTAILSLIGYFHQSTFFHGFDINYLNYAALDDISLLSAQYLLFISALSASVIFIVFLAIVILVLILALFTSSIWTIALPPIGLVSLFVTLVFRAVVVVPEQLLSYFGKIPLRAPVAMAALDQAAKSLKGFDTSIHDMSLRLTDILGDLATSGFYWIGKTIVATHKLFLGLIQFNRRNNYLPFIGTSAAFAIVFSFGTISIANNNVEIVKNCSEDILAETLGLYRTRLVEQDKSKPEQNTAQKSQATLTGFGKAEASAIMFTAVDSTEAAEQAQADLRLALFDVLARRFSDSSGRTVCRATADTKSASGIFEELFQWFDYPIVSVRISRISEPMNGLIVLGTTTRHTFFYSILEQRATVVSSSNIVATKYYPDAQLGDPEGTENVHKELLSRLNNTAEALKGLLGELVSWRGEAKSLGDEVNRFHARLDSLSLALRAQIIKLETRLDYRNVTLLQPFGPLTSPTALSRLKELLVAMKAELDGIRQDALSGHDFKIDRLESLAKIVNEVHVVIPTLNVGLTGPRVTEARLDRFEQALKDLKGHVARWEQSESETLSNVIAALNNLSEAHQTPHPIFIGYDKLFGKGRNLTRKEKEIANLSEPFVLNQYLYKGYADVIANNFQVLLSTLANTNDILRKQWKPDLIKTEPVSRKYLIYFEFDGTDIRSDSEIVLERVVSAIKDSGSKYVTLVGHADTKGPTEYNQTLSEKRVLSVRDFLASAGVGREFITIGKGETDLKVSTPDNSEEQENRRVEIYLH